MSKEYKFDVSISEHDAYCVDITIPEEDRASVLEAMRDSFEALGFLASKGIDTKINFKYPESLSDKKYRQELKRKL